MIEAVVVLRRLQSVVNERSWHGLIFNELTNGQAERPLVIGWLVRERSCVGHWRRQTVPTVMHYCLPIGQFVKN